MTFSTLTFAIFTGLVFAGYWRLQPRRRAQNLLVVVASCVFYAWWDLRFLGLMVGTALTDFLFGKHIAQSLVPRHRRAFLAASILVNLGVLGLFKYFNFFAESFAVLAHALGVSVSEVHLKLVLPIGISFYTFQSMSYTIDVYRRDIEAIRSPLDFLAYVTFFPQLVAGPIERSSNLIPQFLRERSFDPAVAQDGLRQVLWGLFKKMVVADNAALLADWGYSRTGGAEILVGTLAFAFQIYFDFSAYSDIASGTAKLFGFKLMRNFAYPYFSLSVGEFWRRWHISLSTWFRDYLYIPLGGSRVAPARRATNVLATFILSGLWHGASWNFVAWGALNGIGLLMCPGNATPRSNASATPGLFPSPRQCVRMAATFAFISLTWIFFRSPTLEASVSGLRSIAVEATSRQAWAATANLLLLDHPMTVFWIASALAIEWLSRFKEHPLAGIGSAGPIRWAIYTIVVWSCIYYRVPASSQFIYFQF